MSDEELGKAAHDLKDAIERYGMEGDETKRAAIRLCKISGKDPFSKYPLRSGMTLATVVDDNPLQSEVTFEYAWQRMIEKAADLDADRQIFNGKGRRP